jgi:hypothetical protein
MNHVLEQLLHNEGASLVGFANLEGLYAEVDLNEQRS